MLMPMLLLDLFRITDEVQRMHTLATSPLDQISWLFGWHFHCRPALSPTITLSDKALCSSGVSLMITRSRGAARAYRSLSATSQSTAKRMTVSCHEDQRRRRNDRESGMFRVLLFCFLFYRIRRCFLDGKGHWLVAFGRGFGRGSRLGLDNLSCRTVDEDVKWTMPRCIALPNHSPS